ncbi:MAG: hypothetical protein ACRDXX_10010, partial [Stackebrandtia sp.]
LSGVLVPAALLPAVLRPLSALVFLRWSADLLRDAIRLETVPALSTRLLMLSGLGVAGALLAGVLTNAVMRRLRFTARLGES